ncbi:MAG: nucleotide-binding protein [Thermoplasmata archaeon]|nr:nucleotide-binding protein [Candidatus Sysuiplasma acidicola]
MVERNCSNCNRRLENAGEMNFRVGGYAKVGGWLLGNFNQLAESLKTFVIYHCPTCGKVELYEPGVGEQAQS